MAIFHCSCKIIARSKGHSAVAGSAYRNAVNLTNEYDGVDHRYEHKTGVYHSEIMLCENAPSDYMDRETLWNAVEKIEKASDAQLAREYEFSIPRELKSREEQIEFARNFIYENFVSKGMCADFSIHDKGDGNPHVHVMVTMRPIDENGKWENKTETVYLCKNKAGDERAFTKTELEKDKSGEWQKQHHYSKNGDPKGKKIWLTEYEKNNNPKYKKYERIKNDRQPKTEKYGRQNSKIQEWNSKEFLIQVRSNLAAAINNELAIRNYDQRVDHRSYKEQGIKKLPTKHKGKSAIIREEKRNNAKYRDRYSEPTYRIEQNKEIDRLNAELEQIENEISELLNQGRELSEIRWSELKEDCREVCRVLEENWYDETLNTEVLHNIDKYKIELDELVELEQQYNLHKENVYELYGNSSYKVSYVDYHFAEIIQEIEAMRGLAERNLDEIAMERNPEKYPFMFDKPEKENGVAVKESEPKSTERKKNIFERVVEGVSFVVANRAAKKVEEAARKAAEERKRKEAAEAAQKAAEEQAAAAVARRQAARVAEQQRLADISSVKEECERRLNELQGSIFRKLGWDDFEGGRALNRIKYNEKPSEYPVAYKDSYGKLKMKIFTADELQLAKEFINQTKEIFDETVEKRRKEIRDFQNISLNDKIKAGEKIHKQQKENRPEREIKRSSGKEERE